MRLWLGFSHWREDDGKMNLGAASRYVKFTLFQQYWNWSYNAIFCVDGYFMWNIDSFFSKQNHNFLIDLLLRGNERLVRKKVAY